jgi:pseudouridine kinase
MIMANPSGPVLVIGSASMDTVARATEALSKGSSTPGWIRRAYGGVARNIAENLARLDVPTRLITAVGDDEDGRALLAHAADAGIDVEHALVVEDSEVATGGYVALFDQDASLRIAVDQMAPVGAITPKYLRARRSLFREASLVVLDANLSSETIAGALRLARSAHVPALADPAVVPLAHRLVPHLAELTLVASNGVEAATMCGSETPRNSEQAVLTAKRLAALGVETAIVTLADKGVGYATAEVSGHISAMRVVVADSTGAGDAFTAGVIFGLVNEVPIDEAVRLGVSAAAITLRSRHTVVPELSEELLYAQLM